jgi:V/A-type H+-transporting ATPase subunit C
MQKVMASESQEFSHIHPLSVLPIVDFMVRKKIEVDNIRIIARGKESGLDAEQIKKLLVI